MILHVSIQRTLFCELPIANVTYEPTPFAVREHVSFHEVRAHSHAADAARLQDPPAENRRNAHRTYVGASRTFLMTDDARMQRIGEVRAHVTIQVGRMKLSAADAATDPMSTATISYALT